MYIGEDISFWRARQKWRQFEEAIKAEAKTQYAFHVGVDIGKRQDPSALAVIQTETTGDNVRHVLCGLYKIDLHANYADQVSQIMALLDRQALKLWPTEILTDTGAAGEAVNDLLERSGMKFRRVQIVGSGDCTFRGGRYFASRNYLIGLLTKWLNRPNFFISKPMPLYDELKDELLALKHCYSKAGNAYVEGGRHDDLAMATALALLGLERKGRARTGVRPLFPIATLSL